VFEVREEPAPLPPVEDAGTSGRKVTEAVEGEIEMDEGGEGFVNVGFVKVITLLIDNIARVFAVTLAINLICLHVLPV